MVRGSISWKLGTEERRLREAGRFFQGDHVGSLQRRSKRPRAWALATAAVRLLTPSLP